MISNAGGPYPGVSATGNTGGAVRVYDTGNGVYSDSATATGIAGTIILFNPGLAGRRCYASPTRTMKSQQVIADGAGRRRDARPARLAVAGRSGDSALGSAQSAAPPRRSRVGPLGSQDAPPRRPPRSSHVPRSVSGARSRAWRASRIRLPREPMTKISLRSILTLTSFGLVAVTGGTSAAAPDEAPSRPASPTLAPRAADAPEGDTTVHGGVQMLADALDEVSLRPDQADALAELGLAVAPYEREVDQAESEPALDARTSR